MMKKILIIGAGFLQSFVIKKAKEIGYYTIVVDKNPKAVGFDYANEHAVIDIVDEETCLKYAISKDIDGVLTVATDYGVLTAAYIAKHMNLPGINYEIAKVVKNKYLVRRILNENNVDDISQYFEIEDTEVLENIFDIIKFPVMVKPSDGSGSNAAKRVDSLEELKIACNVAMKASIIGKVLIEDFIVGKEYGVESFVYNGEIHIVGILDKLMTKPPNYAELGHCIPSQSNNQEAIKKVVIKAIRALGINFGSVNMDVLVTNDGRVCIIDVGVRMGGNLIGSHLIPLSTGIDYMRNIVQLALGDSVNLKPKSSNINVVTRLLALHPGKVKHLPDLEQIKSKYEVEIYNNIKVGQEIREYKNNLDGCGYVVSVSNNIEEAIVRAETAKKIIDNSIVRE